MDSINTSTNVEDEENGIYVVDGNTNNELEDDEECARILADVEYSNGSYKEGSEPFEDANILDIGESQSRVGSEISRNYQPPLNDETANLITVQVHGSGCVN